MGTSKVLNLVFVLTVYAHQCKVSLADLSPFAPPFLRRVNQGTVHQSSPFSFLGLQPSYPQQQQASSGSLVQENPLYNNKLTNEPVYSFPEPNNIREQPQLSNSDMTNQNIWPDLIYGDTNHRSDAVNSNSISNAQNVPPEGEPAKTSLSAPIHTHEVHGSPNVDFNVLSNSNRNEELGRVQPHSNSEEESANIGDVNNAGTMNRPQLRHLDISSRRNEDLDNSGAYVTNPPINQPPDSSNTITGRQDIPNYNSNSRGSSTQPRRASNNSVRRNAVNNRANRVSEGHRLITRALWRIFDAIMEKNEKAELAERMAHVENTIRSMEEPGSKFESLYEMLKEENLGQDQRLDEMDKKVDEIAHLKERIEKLEAWQQLSFGQNDEELQPGWSDGLPVYTRCPSPFETVNGECFFVAGQNKRSWLDARRDCSSYGGDLAAPRELQSLRTYLESLAYRPEYVWVGASRQGNGEWMWSAGPREGELVDRSQQTWNEDLPSGLGNCMGLYEGASYRAYDFHCVEQDLYVCQFFL